MTSKPRGNSASRERLLTYYQCLLQLFSILDEAEKFVKDFPSLSCLSDPKDTVFLEEIYSMLVQVPEKFGDFQVALLRLKNTLARNRAAVMELRMEINMSEKKDTSRETVATSTEAQDDKSSQQSQKPDSQPKISKVSTTREEEASNP